MNEIKKTWEAPTLAVYYIPNDTRFDAYPGYDGTIVS